MASPAKVSKTLIAGPAGAIEVAAQVPISAALSAVAVVAHPHPLFGGTMENKVATTVARVENLRAEARDDDGVEISWRLADTTAVASLAVERTRDAVAATISEITVAPLDGDEYEILDDSPGPDPSYRLEVRYDDGSSEWFGPVAPVAVEAGPASGGCGADSILGTAGTRLPVVLLLGLTVLGLARRRVRFA